MEEIETNSWQEFEQKLTHVRDNLDGRFSPLLFRGQSNSKEWKLETTLERDGERNMRIGDYYRLIMRIKPDIETFTGKNWDLDDPPKIENLLSSDEGFDHFPTAAIYQYMVYLRHHGFPSPLLDWSMQPAIAALFAFEDRAVGVEKRSIYAFCEMPKATKSFWGNGPRIRNPMHNVRTHPRHLRQQSMYTMCGSFDGSAWRFHSHEDVCASGRSHQDVLWKFNIPSSERVSVLRLLDSYNLNAYSLFDSEESLMRTLWLRNVLLEV
jgi:FRG domain